MPQKVSENLTALPGYRFELFNRGNGEWSFLASELERPNAPIAVIRFGQSRRDPEERTQWDVYSLHVRRSFRRRGIARALHMLALQHANAEGYLLRVDAKPSKAFAPVFKKLRAQRVAFEGADVGRSAVEQ